MGFIKPILWIADPLLIAFMISVLIGVLFRDFSGKILLKYSATILSAVGYVCLIVYTSGILQNEILINIVLFAPLALILIFVILALIFAPKGEVVNSEMDKEFETKKFITGWDSMFPNDLDEYDKHKKD